MSEKSTNRKIIVVAGMTVVAFAPLATTVSCSSKASKADKADVARVAALLQNERLFNTSGSIKTVPEGQSLDIDTINRMKELSSDRNEFIKVNATINENQDPIYDKKVFEDVLYISASPVPASGVYKGTTLSYSVSYSERKDESNQTEYTVTTQVKISKKRASQILTYTTIGYADQMVVEVNRRARELEAKVGKDGDTIVSLLNNIEFMSISEQANAKKLNDEVIQTWKLKKYETPIDEDAEPYEETDPISGVTTTFAQTTTYKLERRAGSLSVIVTITRTATTSTDEISRTKDISWTIRQQSATELISAMKDELKSELDAQKWQGQNFIFSPTEGRDMVDVDTDIILGRSFATTFGLNQNTHDIISKYETYGLLSSFVAEKSTGVKGAGYAVVITLTKDNQNDSTIKFNYNSKDFQASGDQEILNNFVANIYKLSTPPSKTIAQLEALVKKSKAPFDRNAATAIGLGSLPTPPITPNTPGGILLKYTFVKVKEIHGFASEYTFTIYGEGTNLITRVKDFTFVSSDIFEDVDTTIREVENEIIGVLGENDSTIASRSKRGVTDLSAVSGTQLNMQSILDTNENIASINTRGANVTWLVVGDIVTISIAKGTLSRTLTYTIKWFDPLAVKTSLKDLEGIVDLIDTTPSNPNKFTIAQLDSLVSIASVYNNVAAAKFGMGVFEGDPSFTPEPGFDPRAIGLALDRPVPIPADVSFTYSFTKGLVQGNKNVKYTLLISGQTYAGLKVFAKPIEFTSKDVADYSDTEKADIDLFQIKGWMDTVTPIDKPLINYRVTTEWTSIDHDLMQNIGVPPISDAGALPYNSAVEYKLLKLNSNPDEIATFTLMFRTKQKASTSTFNVSKILYSSEMTPDNDASKANKAIEETMNTFPEEGAEVNSTTIAALLETYNGRNGLSNVDGLGLVGHSPVFKTMVSVDVKITPIEGEFRVGSYEVKLIFNRMFSDLAEETRTRTFILNSYDKNELVAREIIGKITKDSHEFRFGTQVTESQIINSWNLNYAINGENPPLPGMFWNAIDIEYNSAKLKITYNGGYSDVDGVAYKDLSFTYSEDPIVKMLQILPKATDTIISNKTKAELDQLSSGRITSFDGLGLPAENTPIIFQDIVVMLTINSVVGAPGEYIITIHLNDTFANKTGEVTFALHSKDRAGLAADQAIQDILAQLPPEGSEADSNEVASILAGVTTIPELQLKDYIVVISGGVTAVVTNVFRSPGVFDTTVVLNHPSTNIIDPEQRTRRFRTNSADKDQLIAQAAIDAITKNDHDFGEWEAIDAAKVLSVWNLVNGTPQGITWTIENIVNATSGGSATIKATYNQSSATKDVIFRYSDPLDLTLKSFPKEGPTVISTSTASMISTANGQQGISGVNLLGLPGTPTLWPNVNAGISVTELQIGSFKVVIDFVHIPSSSTAKRTYTIYSADRDSLIANDEIRRTLAKLPAEGSMDTISTAKGADLMNANALNAIGLGSLGLPGSPTLFSGHTAAITVAKTPGEVGIYDVIVEIKHPKSTWTQAERSRTFKVESADRAELIANAAILDSLDTFPMQDSIIDSLSRDTILDTADEIPELGIDPSPVLVQGVTAIISTSEVSLGTYFVSVELNYPGTKMTQAERTRTFTLNALNKNQLLADKTIMDILGLLPVQGSVNNNASTDASEIELATTLENLGLNNNPTLSNNVSVSITPSKVSIGTYNIVLVLSHPNTTIPEVTRTRSFRLNSKDKNQLIAEDIASRIPFTSKVLPYGSPTTDTDLKREWNLVDGKAFDSNGDHVDFIGVSWQVIAIGDKKATIRVNYGGARVDVPITWTFTGNPIDEALQSLPEQGSTATSNEIANNLYFATSIDSLKLIGFSPVIAQSLSVDVSITEYGVGVFTVSINLRDSISGETGFVMFYLEAKDKDILIAHAAIAALLRLLPTEGSSNAISTSNAADIDGTNIFRQLGLPGDPVPTNGVIARVTQARYLSLGVYEITIVVDHPDVSSSSSDPSYYPLASRTRSFRLNSKDKNFLIAEDALNKLNKTSHEFPFGTIVGVNEVRTAWNLVNGTPPGITWTVNMVDDKNAIINAIYGGVQASLPVTFTYQGNPVEELLNKLPTKYSLGNKSNSNATRIIGSDVTNDINELGILDSNDNEQTFVIDSELTVEIVIFQKSLGVFEIEIILTHTSGYSNSTVFELISSDRDELVANAAINAVLNALPAEGSAAAANISQKDAVDILSANGTGLLSALGLPLNPTADNGVVVAITVTTTSIGTYSITVVLSHPHTSISNLTRRFGLTAKNRNTLVAQAALDAIDQKDSHVFPYGTVVTTDTVKTVWNIFDSSNYPSHIPAGVVWSYANFDKDKGVTIRASFGSAMLTKVVTWTFTGNPITDSFATLPLNGANVNSSNNAVLIETAKTNVTTLGLLGFTPVIHPALDVDITVNKISAGVYSIRITLTYNLNGEFDSVDFTLNSFDKAQLMADLAITELMKKLPLEGSTNNISSKVAADIAAANGGALVALGLAGNPSATQENVLIPVSVKTTQVPGMLGRFNIELRISHPDSSFAEIILNFVLNSSDQNLLIAQDALSKITKTSHAFEFGATIDNARIRQEWELDTTHVYPGISWSILGVSDTGAVLRATYNGVSAQKNLTFTINGNPISDALATLPTDGSDVLSNADEAELLLLVGQTSPYPSDINLLKMVLDDEPILDGPNGTVEVEIRITKRSTGIFNVTLNLLHRVSGATGSVTFNLTSVDKDILIANEAVNEFMAKLPAAGSTVTSGTTAANIAAATSAAQLALPGNPTPSPLLTVTITTKNKVSTGVYTITITVSAPFTTVSQLTRTFTLNSSDRNQLIAQEAIDTIKHKTSHDDFDFGYVVTEADVKTLWNLVNGTPAGITWSVELISNTGATIRATYGGQSANHVVAFNYKGNPIADAEANLPEDGDIVESTEFAAAIQVATDIPSLGLIGHSGELTGPNGTVSASVTVTPLNLGEFSVRIILTHAISGATKTITFTLNSIDKQTLNANAALNEILNKLPAQDSTNSISRVNADVIATANTIMGLGLDGNPVPSPIVTAVVSVLKLSTGTYKITITVSSPGSTIPTANLTRNFTLNSADKNILIAQEAIDSIKHKTTHEFDFGIAVDAPLILSTWNLVNGTPAGIFWEVIGISRDGATIRARYSGQPADLPVTFTYKGNPIADIIKELPKSGDEINSTATQAELMGANDIPSLAMPGMNPSLTTPNGVVTATVVSTKSSTGVFAVTITLFHAASNTTEIISFILNSVDKNELVANESIRAIKLTLPSTPIVTSSNLASVIAVQGNQLSSLGLPGNPLLGNGVTAVITRSKTSTGVYAITIVLEHSDTTISLSERTISFTLYSSDKDQLIAQEAIATHILELEKQFIFGTNVTTDYIRTQWNLVDGTPTGITWNIALQTANSAQIRATYGSATATQVVTWIFTGNPVEDSLNTFPAINAVIDSNNTAAQIESAHGSVEMNDPTAQNALVSLLGLNSFTLDPLLTKVRIAVIKNETGVYGITITLEHDMSASGGLHTVGSRSFTLNSSDKATLIGNKAIADLVAILPATTSTLNSTVNAAPLSTANSIAALGLPGAPVVPNGIVQNVLVSPLPTIGQYSVQIKVWHPDATGPNSLANAITYTYILNSKDQNELHAQDAIASIASKTTHVFPFGTPITDVELKNAWSLVDGAPHVGILWSITGTNLVTNSAVIRASYNGAIATLPINWSFSGNPVVDALIGTNLPLNGANVISDLTHTSIESSNTVGITALGLPSSYAQVIDPSVTVTISWIFSSTGVYSITIELHHALSGQRGSTTFTLNASNKATLIADKAMNDFSAALPNEGATGVISAHNANVILLATNNVSALGLPGGPVAGTGIVVEITTTQKGASGEDLGYINVVIKYSHTDSSLGQQTRSFQVVSLDRNMLVAQDAINGITKFDHNFSYTQTITQEMIFAPDAWNLVNGTPTGIAWTTSNITTNGAVIRATYNGATAQLSVTFTIEGNPLAATLASLPSSGSIVNSSKLAAELSAQNGVTNDLSNLGLAGYTPVLGSGVTSVITATESSLGVFTIEIVLNHAVAGTSTVNLTVNSSDKELLIANAKMQDILSKLPTNGSTVNSSVTAATIEAALQIQNLGLPGAPVPDSGITQSVSKNKLSLGTYTITITVSHPEATSPATETRTFTLISSDINYLHALEAINNISKTTHEFEFGTVVDSAKIIAAWGLVNNTPSGVFWSVNPVNTASATIRATYNSVEATKVINFTIAGNPLPDAIASLPNGSVDIISNNTAAGIAVATTIDELMMVGVTPNISPDITVTVTPAYSDLGYYSIRIVLYHAISGQSRDTTFFLVSVDRAELIADDIVQKLLDSLPTNSSNIISTVNANVINNATSVSQLGLPTTPAVGSGIVQTVTKTQNSIGEFTITVKFHHPASNMGEQTRIFNLTSADKNLLYAQDAINGISKTTHQFPWGLSIDSSVIISTWSLVNDQPHAGIVWSVSGIPATNPSVATITASYNGVTASKVVNYTFTGNPVSEAIATLPTNGANVFSNNPAATIEEGVDEDNVVKLALVGYSPAFEPTVTVQISSVVQTLGVYSITIDVQHTLTSTSQSVTFTLHSSDKANLIADDLIQKLTNDLPAAAGTHTSSSTEAQIMAASSVSALGLPGNPVPGVGIVANVAKNRTSIGTFTITITYHHPDSTIAPATSPLTRIFVLHASNRNQLIAQDAINGITMTEKEYEYMFNVTEAIVKADWNLVNDVPYVGIRWNVVGLVTGGATIEATFGGATASLPIIFRYTGNPVADTLDRLPADGLTINSSAIHTVIENATTIAELALSGYPPFVGPNVDVTLTITKLSTGTYEVKVDLLHAASGTRGSVTFKVNSSDRNQLLADDAVMSFFNALPAEGSSVVSTSTGVQINGASTVAGLGLPTTPTATNSINVSVNKSTISTGTYTITITVSHPSATIGNKVRIFTLIASNRDDMVAQVAIDAITKFNHEFIYGTFVDEDMVKAEWNLVNGTPAGITWTVDGVETKGATTGIINALYGAGKASLNVTFRYTGNPVVELLNSLPASNSTVQSNSNGVAIAAATTIADLRLVGYTPAIEPSLVINLVIGNPSLGVYMVTVNISHPISGESGSVTFILEASNKNEIIADDGMIKIIAALPAHGATNVVSTNTAAVISVANNIASLGLPGSPSAAPGISVVVSRSPISGKPGEFNISLNISHPSSTIGTTIIAFTLHASNKNALIAQAAINSSITFDTIAFEYGEVINGSTILGEKGWNLVDDTPVGIAWSVTGINGDSANIRATYTSQSEPLQPDGFAEKAISWTFKGNPVVESAATLPLNGADVNSNATQSEIIAAINNVADLALIGYTPVIHPTVNVFISATPTSAPGVLTVQIQLTHAVAPSETRTFTINSSDKARLTANKNIDTLLAYLPAANSTNTISTSNASVIAVASSIAALGLPGTLPSISGMSITVNTSKVATTEYPAPTYYPGYYLVTITISHPQSSYGTSTRTFYLNSKDKSKLIAEHAISLYNSKTSHEFDYATSVGINEVKAVWLLADGTPTGITWSLDTVAVDGTGANIRADHIDGGFAMFAVVFTYEGDPISAALSSLPGSNADVNSFATDAEIKVASTIAQLRLDGFTPIIDNSVTVTLLVTPFSPGIYIVSITLSHPVANGANRTFKVHASDKSVVLAADNLRRAQEAIASIDSKTTHEWPYAHVPSSADVRDRWGISVNNIPIGVTWTISALSLAGATINATVGSGTPEARTSSFNVTFTYAPNPAISDIAIIKAEMLLSIGAEGALVSNLRDWDWRQMPHVAPGTPFNNASIARYKINGSMPLDMLGVSSTQQMSKVGSVMTIVIELYKNGVSDRLTYTIAEPPYIKTMDEVERIQAMCTPQIDPSTGNTIYLIQSTLPNFAINLPEYYFTNGISPTVDPFFLGTPISGTTRTYSYRGRDDANGTLGITVVVKAPGFPDAEFWVRTIGYNSWWKQTKLIADNLLALPNTSKTTESPSSLVSGPHTFANFGTSSPVSSTYTYEIMNGSAVADDLNGIIWVKVKVTRTATPLIFNESGMVAIRGFASATEAIALQAVQEEKARLESLTNQMRTLPYGTGMPVAGTTHTAGAFFNAVKNQIKLTNSELLYSIYVSSSGGSSIIATITITHKYIVSAVATTFALSLTVSSVPETDISVATDVAAMRNALNVQTYASTNGFLKSTFDQAVLDSRPSTAESELNVGAITVLLGLNVSLPKNPKLIHDTRYSYNARTRVLTLAFYYNGVWKHSEAILVTANAIPSAQEVSDWKLNQAIALLPPAGTDSLSTRTEAQLKTATTLTHLGLAKVPTFASGVTLKSLITSEDSSGHFAVVVTLTDGTRDESVAFGLVATDSNGGVKASFEIQWIVRHIESLYTDVGIGVKLPSEVFWSDMIDFYPNYKSNTNYRYTLKVLNKNDLSGNIMIEVEVALPANATIFAKTRVISIEGFRNINQSLLDVEKKRIHNLQWTSLVNFAAPSGFQGDEAGVKARVIDIINASSGFKIEFLTNPQWYYQKPGNFITQFRLTHIASNTYEDFSLQWSGHGGSAPAGGPQP